MDLKKLAEPFPAEDIEWRIGMSGVKNDGSPWAKALAYITARAIHDRLDNVCGPDKWQLRYIEHLGATVCEIGISCGEGWVWKSGGSDQTQFEAFKGGLSGAEKRAGVPWGIGRYLYKLTETWVKTSPKKTNECTNYQAAQKAKNNKPGVPAFYWAIPMLPDWALPKQPEQKQDHQWQGNQKSKYVALLQSVGMDLDNGKDLIEFYLANTGQTKMTQEQVVYLVDNFNHVVDEFKAYLDNA